jgi:glycosyltransferase involved in cell wall biosynthesis
MNNNVDHQIHVRHVEMSHTSLNLTGGEKALIEIVRYLAKYKYIKQTIYTSESGKLLYTKLLGADAKSVAFRITGSINLEAKSEYVAYFCRVFQQRKLAEKFNGDMTNIIFSHEEFMPTTLLSLRLKKMNQQAHWLGFFHMKSPRIMHGFEGEYTNKYRPPSIFIIRYKLEQAVFFLLSKGKMDQIVTVSPIYKEFLAKKYRGSYALKTFGGEVPVIINKYSGVEVKASTGEVTYDLCFMGRFHAQKGIFELVDIVKRLKSDFPNIKIAVVGGGSNGFEEKLRSLIRANNLEDNFILKGYISGNEKFDILARSKIFVMPSYYESFGQVILEAMKLGLPVVAYDLPPFVVFDRGIVKVPILNNEAMASEISRLLNDQEYYARIRKDAKEGSSEFSWNKTGEEIKSLIDNIMQQGEK